MVNGNGANGECRYSRVITEMDHEPWTQERAASNNLAMDRLLKHFEMLDRMEAEQERSRFQQADATILERARAYLEKCPPAVSGQKGHNQAFATVRAIVYGFDLGADAGFEVIKAHYNPLCLPPWSDAELRHKCQDADTKPFDKPRGWLLKERPSESTNGHTNGKTHNRIPGEAKTGKQGQPPRLETYTLTDLLAMDLPVPNWAVPGLLCEGLSILAGKPKLGKSWMALNLAITIAGGGTALGMAKTTPGDVLYLALEDRLRRVKDRAQRLLPGIDCQASTRLRVAVACPRMYDGGLDLVDKWMQSVERPTLVVIDVWQKFRPMLKNGSQYEQDYEAANGVKEIADKNSCSVLIVHHTKKAPAEDVMDEVSGTLGLVGAADGTLVLVRARNENEGKLHLTGRDIEEQELALQFNPHTFAWRSLGDARKRDASRVKTAILSIFQRSPGSAFWPSEMAEMIEMEKGVVKTTMWRMERDGELKKIGSKYGWPADEVGGGQWEEVSDPPSGSL